MKFSGNAILATVVALILIVVGLVVGLAATNKGLDQNSTPIITTILGLVASIVVSLVTLLKVDATRQDLRNGLIPNKIREAAEQGHITPARTSDRTRSTDPQNGGEVVHGNAVDESGGNAGKPVDSQ